MQLFPSSLRCSLMCLGQTAPKAATTATFLVVHRLRLRASTAGGAGSIPGQGTKISHVPWHGQHIKNEKHSKQTKRNYCHRPLLLLLYFPSSEIFPSRCFSVTPTDFANLYQELQTLVHHSADIVSKYTMYFLSSLSCLPLNSDFLRGGITPSRLL